MYKTPTLILALLSLSAAGTVLAIGSNPPPPLTNINAAPANADKSASVYNGYTQQEVDTTVIHAEHAYQGGQVSEIHDHLHHVINCLEGPNGPDFDNKAEDPCAHMGGGALNDVPAGSDAHKNLERALSDAKTGLKKTKTRDAQEYAKKVLNDVEKVQSQYKQ